MSTDRKQHRPTQAAVMEYMYAHPGKAWPVSTVAAKTGRMATSVSAVLRRYARTEGSTIEAVPSMGQGWYICTVGKAEEEPALETGTMLETIGVSSKDGRPLARDTNGAVWALTRY